MPTWPKAVDPAYRGEAHEEAIVPRGLVELRVHGVSGGTPERNLDDPNPIQVSGDATAGFYHRRPELKTKQKPFEPEPEPEPGQPKEIGPSQAPTHPDPMAEPERTVEAYNWSSINSKKKGRGRWIFLFPFAFANLAGYLIPKDLKPWRRSSAQILLRLVAVVTTVAALLGVTLIAVDLIGVQCGGSAGCTDRFWLGWLETVVGWGDLGEKATQRAVLLAVVPLMALLALWSFGRRSAVYENYGSPVVTPEWKETNRRDVRNPRMDDVRMGELAFWQAPDVVYFQGWLHTAAGIATVAGTMAIALREMTEDGSASHDGLLWLAIASWVLLGLAGVGVAGAHWLRQVPRLWVRRKGPGLVRRPWLFAGLGVTALIFAVVRWGGEFEVLDWILFGLTLSGLVAAYLARKVQTKVIRPLQLPGLLAIALIIAIGVVGWNAPQGADGPPLEAIRNSLIISTLVGAGAVGFTWFLIRTLWLLLAVGGIGAAAFFVLLRGEAVFFIDVSASAWIAIEAVVAVAGVVVIWAIGRKQGPLLGEKAARAHRHYPAYVYVGLGAVAVAGIAAAARQGSLWLIIPIPIVYLFIQLAVLARRGHDHPPPEEMREGVAAVLAGLALTSVLTLVSSLGVFVAQRLGSDTAHTENGVPTTAIATLSRGPSVVWDADGSRPVLRGSGKLTLHLDAALLEAGVLVDLSVDLDAVASERLKRTDRAGDEYKDADKFVTSGTVLVRSDVDLSALQDTGATVVVAESAYASYQAEILLVDGSFDPEQGPGSSIRSPDDLEPVLLAVSPGGEGTAADKEGSAVFAPAGLDGASIELAEGAAVVFRGSMAGQVIEGARIEIDDLFATFDGGVPALDATLVEFRADRIVVDGTPRIFYPAELGWYAAAAVAGFLVFVITILFRFATLGLFRWGSHLGFHRKWGKGKDLDEEYDADTRSDVGHDFSEEEEGRRRRFASKSAFYRLAANLIDDIDWVMSSAVFTTMGLILAITVGRFYNTVPGREWHQLIGLATVAVGVVWVFVYGLVRQAGEDGALRRQLGTVWDVTSFFPRRFHPLAPPCYAERSVIDIRDRLIGIRAVEADETTGAGEGRVVIVAHSAGTLLVSAALLTLMDDEERLRRFKPAPEVPADEGKERDFMPLGLQRRKGHPIPTGAELDGIALVTYGCMLRRIFSRAWPDQLPLDDLKELKERLGDSQPVPDSFSCAPQGKVSRWVNFGRHTDYLGGRVFAELQQMPTRFERLPERTLLYPERPDDIFFLDPTRRWRYRGQQEHARMWTHSFNYQSDWEDQRFRDHVYRVGWALKGDELPLPHPEECGCHPKPSVFLALIGVDEIYDRMLRLAWVGTLANLAGSDAADLHEDLASVKSAHPELHEAPPLATIARWIAEAKKLVSA